MSPPPFRDVSETVVGVTILAARSSAEAAAPHDRIRVGCARVSTRGQDHRAQLDALPEELLFRGSLLLVVAWVGSIERTRVRRGAVTAFLVISAVVFGYTRLGWSMLNAFTAAVAGLLYGAVAIWARSLWPAILAYAVLSLWVGTLYMASPS